jgi:hypothetical protein
MSIINNIQGTLTQTQNIQQLQQQQGDVSKVQQQVGEIKTQEDSELRKNSISEQEDVDMDGLSKDKESGGQQKGRKGRKKTLDELMKEDSSPRDPSMGGGLIDTQA